MYEISSVTSTGNTDLVNNMYSWYSDYSHFLNGSKPFFHRGGIAREENRCGIFFFSWHPGIVQQMSFRVVVPVL